MDLTSLSQLVPLGGVSVLLVYLLGTLIADRSTMRHERDSWVQERDAMRLQHRRDLGDVTSDLRDQIAFLRDRINELETEVRTLRHKGTP